MDIVKSPSEENEDIHEFLESFKNVLVSLKLPQHSTFKSICSNREFLENVLMSNGLDVTPSLITHLFLLLNNLSKSSSSSIFNWLSMYYANSKIIQALLDIVDANVIKMLMNNNETTSNCSNEVINERVKEIENLKSKLFECTSISTTFCSDHFHKVKSFDSNSMKIKIRKNKASILRTGAMITKKMKHNDAIVEKIIAGGSNPYLHEMNIENIIKSAHEKEVEEIERRHLLGLISCEEAKIAKIDAIKRKQKSARDLKKEKNRLRNLMNEECARSVSKSKVIIRKIHLSRLMMKRKKFDVVFGKKINADEVKRIHRKLQLEIKAMRQEEMEKKIKLIQKIRILEKNRHLKGKSSKDCLKMSIDELRASIENLQQQINHERENRQKRIHEEHIRHKQLIQNTETLIEIGRKLNRCRDQMRIEKVKRHSNVASTAPDLMELREKLVQVRKIVANAAGT